MHPEALQQEFLKPDFIIKTVIRNRWFLIIPFIAALAVGSYFAIKLPKIYEAQTLILIEPQSVPANYVRSVVSADIDERINTLSQQILSRSNLERIIRQFDMFSGPAYGGMFMEDKVAALRSRIDIDVTRNRRATNSFRVIYKDRVPETAMKVTNALASFFIEENLKDREAQAIGTTDFLESELEAMRKRLTTQEDAVRAYRTEHLGELPGQLEANLRNLDRLQQQLNERQESLRDARSRLTLLQNQASAGLLANQQGNGAARGRQPNPLDPDALRAELARLEFRYTDKHPDIVKIKQQIKDLEDRGITSGDNTAPQEPFKISEVRREIEKIATDIVSIQSQIADYERRVEATPKREQELMKLERDYDNLRASYNSLLNRKLEADISVNMERKQKGEQFRVLDRAQLPNRPVDPDMRKIFLMTIAGGLAIGAGIVFLLEYTNAKFRTPKEVELALGLPTLALVPFIENPKARIVKTANWIATGFALVVASIMLMVFASLTLRGVEETIAVVSSVKHVLL